MQLQSKVYIIGTYQAVCEVGMEAWRSGDLVNLSSEGICPLDPEAGSGSNLHILVCTCEHVTGNAGMHCEDLAARFPTVLVGLSVAGSGDRELPADHCFWGATGFLGNVHIVSELTGSSPTSLPPEVRDQVDDSISAGAISLTCVPRLHEHARERFEREARNRFHSALASRWTLLTRSVAALGLEGFSPGQVSKVSAPESARLSAAIQDAISMGVASWVDAVMFAPRDSHGSDYSGAPSAGVRPFSDADHAGWSQRHLNFLRAVAQAAPGDPLMGPVTEVLASPSARLQGGAHPMTWLVSLPVSRDNLAREGLSKLIDLVGTHSDTYYGPQVQQQAVQAIAATGYSSESIRLTERMGLSPGQIASRVLPVKNAAADEQRWVTAGLVVGFKGLYGSIAQFPAELARAFQDRNEPVAQAFEALKTEEMMAATIANWRPAASEPTSAVKVTVKRRRTLA